MAASVWSWGRPCSCVASRRDLRAWGGGGRQVYTGLDIGSAKPSLAEQAAVKYHLLDIVAPTEVPSLAATSLFHREC